MIATLRKLLAVAPAPRGRLALSILLGVLTVVFGIGLMATAGYLIARAAERPTILSLGVAIAAVRFFGLARPLARYLERLVSHDVAFRVLAGLRVRFYERIEPLTPAGLEQFRRGDLVSRLVADTDALQSLYLRGLGPPLVALAAGAVAVGVAAAILPTAAVVLALGLLAAGVVPPVAAGLLARRSGGARAGLQGELAAELVEVLRGASELVVYGREDEALERLRERDRALARIARRDALAAGVADGLGIVLAGATTVAVLATAVAAHSAGSLDRVLVAVLALLALSSFEAMTPLSLAARELASTLAAGRRVLDVIEREPAVRDPAEPAGVDALEPSISFDGVAAGYPSADDLVLDGLSLDLPAGSKVALVGPSGVGKTTVVNLLLRFLDPVAGRVTLGGRDLRDLRQEDVRRAVAVAGQDSHLFSTSIRENVRLAKRDATDEELENALRLARIWDWVSSLPDGLDTPVGEEGAQLSGGQRQRIVLARAFLSQAPVLVLDEPTSQLDPETAEALVRDVVAGADGRSLLLITHRSEGLDLVDEIVTLDGGRAAYA